MNKLLLAIYELINLLKSELIKPNAIITIEDYDNSSGLKFRFLWLDDVANEISYVVLYEEFQSAFIDRQIMTSMMAKINNELKTLKGESQ